MNATTLTPFPYHAELRGLQAGMVLRQRSPFLPKSLWFGWEKIEPSTAITVPDDNAKVVLKYTVAGEGQMLWQGKRYALTPGQICLIPGDPPSEVTAVSAAVRWETVTMVINGSDFVRHFRFILDQTGPVTQLPPRHQIVYILMDLFHQAYQRPVHSPYNIAEQLFHLLLEFHRLAHTMDIYGDDSHLAGVMAYVDNHYAEDISAAQLAERAHVSESHLYYLFRKYTGFTPGQYLMQARIQKARELLRHTELNLGEIAKRIGLASAEHLNKLFKKEMGLTPMTYRRTWKTFGEGNEEQSG